MRINSFFIVVSVFCISVLCFLLYKYAEIITSGEYRYAVECIKKDKFIRSEIGDGFSIGWDLTYSSGPSDSTGFTKYHRYKFKVYGTKRTGVVKIRLDSSNDPHRIKLSKIELLEDEDDGF